MKTLVLGASLNPSRASFQAIQRLRQQAHEVVALGLRAGEVAGVTIGTDRPEVVGIDTVTLYLGAANQVGWYDYLLGLKPRRIIFNPGAENAEFEELARSAGVETEEACTLVLLGTGQY